MSTKKRIVKDSGRKPCGCYYEHYGDGTGVLSPCVGHALISAAQGLGQAASALGACGERLLKEQQAQEFRAAVEKFAP